MVMCCWGGFGLGRGWIGFRSEQGRAVPVTPDYCAFGNAVFCCGKGHGREGKARRTVWGPAPVPEAGGQCGAQLPPRARGCREGGAEVGGARPQPFRGEGRWNRGSRCRRADMDNRKDEKSRTLCASSEEGLKGRGKEKRKRKRSRSRSSSVSSTSSSGSTSTSSSSSRSSSRSSSSSSSRDSPKSKSKKKKKEKHNKKKRKKDNKMKKKKEKKKRKEKTGPVQLSKFFKNKKKNENYSMITGKKIKMKIKKTKEDIERDRNRAQLLEFLNSAL